MKTAEEMAEQVATEYESQYTDLRSARHDAALAAVEADRAQRDTSIHYAIVQELRELGFDDTADWADAAENADELYENFIQPMLDDVREEH